MTDTVMDAGDTDAALIAQLESRAERRNERREFFRTALGAGAVAAVGVAAVTLGSGVAAQSVNDATTLNFALNLEYLEAQFYSYAVTGAGLANTLLTPGSASTTTQGVVTGGRQVSFSDPLVAQYAREIAADEVAHVTFLRSQLGTAAVAQPAIDIGSTATSAFSVAAAAAGLVAAGAAFDPYASDENFLLAAYLFEDVGVTAYKAAASLLESKVYLDAAAGILAAEAYHASIIRTVLYRKGLDTPSLRTSADAISNARDGLDGTTDDDQGISPVTLTSTLTSTTTPGSYAPQVPAALLGLASNIVPSGPDGTVFGRSFGAVLNIVYLNRLAVVKGGFFPNGVNGSFVTSAAN
jgi:hypothetical protein